MTEAKKKRTNADIVSIRIYIGIFFLNGELAMKTFNSLTLIILMFVFSGSVYSAGSEVDYPEGYRNWFHVKTMLIKPGHQLENPFQGIHHVYANSKAVSGLKKGIYPDGSVLVFDLLNYSDKDLTIQEGARKLLGIMYKNSQKYGSTGGWGFEAFSADSKTERLVNDAGKSCFACHSPAKKSDYVFSQFRK
jgi:hypothetical protein